MIDGSAQRAEGISTPADVHRRTSQDVRPTSRHPCGP
jgi:hypothetical protein